MTSKKGLLKRSRLYLVLDAKSCADGKKIRRLIRAEAVDIIQLRVKNSPKIEILKKALRLKGLTEKEKVIFIVNDCADIAKISGADGVHIGRSDITIGRARKLLGRDKIIGKTCRNLRQILAAKTQGADYVSLGPVFPSATKSGITPLGLAFLKKIEPRKLGLPLFAIGGINSSNLEAVLAGGINRIAACAAICKSAKPLAAAKKLKAQLKQKEKR